MITTITRRSHTGTSRTANTHPAVLAVAAVILFGFGYFTGRVSHQSVSGKATDANESSEVGIQGELERIHQSHLEVEEMLGPPTQLRIGQSFSTDHMSITLNAATIGNPPVMSLSGQPLVSKETGLVLRFRITNISERKLLRINPRGWIGERTFRVTDDAGNELEEVYMDYFVRLEATADLVAKLRPGEEVEHSVFVDKPLDNTKFVICRVLLKRFDESANQNEVEYVVNAEDFGSLQ